MNLLSTRRISSLGLAFALLAAAVLYAGLFASPAGANTADDTCRQVGDELIYDLGEGPGPFNRRVYLREVFPNGNSAWVATADDTGSVSIDDIDAEYSIRYRTDVDGQRQINDVPCTVDPDAGDDSPPRIDCQVNRFSGSIEWNDSPNDLQAIRFSVRQGDPDGESRWLTTQLFGYYNPGQTGTDYFIRFRVGGEVFNETCSGGNPDDLNFCTHNQFLVKWQLAPHADENYHLRQRFDDGSSRWVETTTETLILGPNIDGDADYFIRYWVDAGDGTLMSVDNDCV